MKPIPINEINRIKSIFETLKKTINLSVMDDFEYDNPYTLLVQVIMSARATDRQVEKVALRLFPMIKTPYDMLALGIDELLIRMSSLSLYRNKAKNIIAMSQMLIDKFDTKVPDTREALMSLPGVGRKSADVMLNGLYKKPVIAVDTHVAQFAHIMNLTKSHNRDKIADELEYLLPQCLDPDTLVDAHFLMVLYNQRICTGSLKKGHICPIEGYCEIKRKQREILKMVRK